MKLYKIEAGQLQTNCYLWADEATMKAIVIDAADNADEIIKFAEQNQLKITDIILTHGHFDHMMAVAELKEKTGARLSVFEKTVDFLSDDMLNGSGLFGFEFEHTTADKILHHGEEIDFCGNKIRVINTPGHTADSICLYHKDTLISGDTLFCRSVGRADLPTGDMRTLIHSIQTKLLVLPESAKVYPGHGPATTIGEESRGNPYLR